MPVARYLLAHKKDVPHDTLVTWRAQLLELLETPGYDVVVVLGTEDYDQNAWNLGGWEMWAADIGQRTDYRGEPSFHGVIVPVVDTFTIGKATADILHGFWKTGKYRMAYSPFEGALRHLTGVRVIDRTDYIQHAEIVL